MAQVREILDSEDDGSDFSPVRAPMPHDAHMYSREIRDQLEDHQADDKPIDNTATTTTTQSTDPLFFQRVYDEQRAAASDQHDPALLVPESIPHPTSQPDNGTGTSSLTALTDPPPPGRKSKKTGASTMNQLADITQITTPSGNPGSRPSDPWDVPSSSPPQAAQMPRSLSKPARTYGKRKSTDGVREDMPATQDPYAFPSTADQQLPPRSRKKTKRAAPVADQTHDYSSTTDLALVEDESTFSRRPSKLRSLEDTSSGSLIPDTYATGLYITPSALTASQKQQYQLVSLSSEMGPETLETAQAQNSSYTSTIAYPTPSRYAGGSPERRTLQPDDIPSTDGVDMLPIIPEPVMLNLPSSPDVIGEESRRSKRSRPWPTSAEVPASSQTTPARSTKKRKTVQPAPEDTENREPRTPKPAERVDAHDKTPNVEQAALGDQTPQGSSTRRSSRAKRPPSRLIDAPSPLASTMDPLAYEEMPEISTQAVEEAPPKKKRGRKKKEVLPEQAVPDAPMDEALFEPPKEDEIPDTEDVQPLEAEAPKRKRGRPRKSVAQPIIIDIDSEPEVSAAPVNEPTPQAEEEPVEEPRPTQTKKPAAKAKGAKRGRKKKQDTAKSAELVQEEEEQQNPELSTALSQKSENSRPLSAKKEIPASDDEDDGDYGGQQKENERKAAKSETPAGPEEAPVKAAPAKDPPVKKELAKPTTAVAASAGKVPYRVGLSKRSRIAPLLKSLRK